MLDVKARSRTSNAAIDRLGEKIAFELVTGDDLRDLDAWRRTFTSAYEEVVRLTRDMLKLAPTGRPAKSTPSIIDKLRRESIRLSQMQDIAGCRVVVSDSLEQDAIVLRLNGVVADATVVDRRKVPSYGYRAVHVIAKLHGRQVEIQVRTALQHSWAELSEKLSDRLGPSLKYGEGDPSITGLLGSWSDQIGEIEELEWSIANNAQDFLSETNAADAMGDLSARLVSVRRDLRQTLEDLTAKLA